MRSSLVVPALVVLCLAALGLGATSTPPPTTPPLARSTGADTLRHEVEAGRTLIVELPERLGDRPVAAYAMLRTPALSDLAGRSFFWRTRPVDLGTHTLRFLATPATNDAEDISPDTLEVTVVVRD